MKVTVVIPTLAGRERNCERTVAAYKAQGAEVLIVKGSPTCGEGWAAGLRQSKTSMTLLGIDDAEPHPGAVEAGAEAALCGIYPSPRIVRADGSLESCGTLGGGLHLGECPDGTLAYMSSLPIAAYWRQIGEPLPIHYYADDHLGYMARKAGFPCEVVRDYAFTHHEETHGRAKVIARAAADRETFLASLT